MNNYYFDVAGCYCDSAPANPGTLPPANALRIPPPEADGFIAVVNTRRDGWELLPDYRGRKGWLAGVESTIVAAGALPEGWSDNPPEEPDTRTYKEKRLTAFIHESDFHRDAALSYQSEAAAWRLLGDIDKAVAAEAKAETSLKHYAVEKERIRLRYPAQTS